ncbi:MAG: LysR family transcriptional regulator [Candidatus Bathyarchaeota archaeon]|nr:LysR family transcriptional regulator [Candidatus Bathyarchaeota archaeon]
MPVSRVRGRSSERIARGILERLGYKILETNKKITVDEAEAFEVDILALNPKGEKYCVEVKAGSASVSDIRQVFADSEILGLKPLLVCKGFADEAAEAVAKELKVELVRLSEYYILLEPEELEVIVRTAVQDVLDSYGFYPLPAWRAVEEEDLELMEKIAETEDFTEAAKSLHLSTEELGQRIGRLRQKGVFPQRGQDFTALKRHSQQIIHRYALFRRLDEIEKRLKRIEESL